MAEGTTVTNTSSELPAWAGPYMSDMLGRAQALSYTPYQAYPGQRLADFTPQQTQAFGMVQQMADQGLPWQTNAGSELAMQGGIAGLNTGQWTDPGVSQSYMSPYATNVSNVQNQELLRQAELQRNQNQARAVQAGAYGGSRHGFVDSEMYRNTQQQMNNNTQTALQAAYQSGMGQYNADRSAMLQGAGQAIQGGQALGSLGQSAYGQGTGIASLQYGMGAQQQNLAQKGYDIDYGNFQNQVNHPYNQLNFANATLRGAPQSSSTSQTQTMTEPDPSWWSQIAGAGIAGASLYNMGTKSGWW